MKLGRRLCWAVVVLAALAAAAQFWLLRETQKAAQRVVAQLAGYGELRYERLWANLWGSGTARNLSFRPGGIMQANFGLPFGYEMTLRELKLRDLDFDGHGAVRRLKLRLSGLRLPVIPGYKRAGRNPGPGFDQLGYANLDFDIDLDIRLIPEARLALVKGDAHGVELADFRFDLQLEIDGARARRAPDQVGLRRLVLEYTDAGLMRRYQNEQALRLHLNLPAARRAAIEELNRRARRERWRWDEESAAAVRDFISDPVYARVEMDPPAEVIMKNLRLYAIGDWPQLLGFRFSTRRPAPEG